AKSTKDETENRAENALHAWVEAYLPGAGWVGLDPTNGVWCDHHYIAVAAGPDPKSIAPISGSYFFDKETGSKLIADIEITTEV
ncbi:MAG: transglutaminase family protein, partial [Chthoniobacterales bacterium]